MRAACQTTHIGSQTQHQCTFGSLYPSSSTSVFSTLMLPNAAGGSNLKLSLMTALRYGKRAKSFHSTRRGTGVLAVARSPPPVETNTDSPSHGNKHACQIRYCDSGMDNSCQVYAIKHHCISPSIYLNCSCNSSSSSTMTNKQRTALLLRHCPSPASSSAKRSWQVG